MKNELSKNEDFMTLESAKADAAKAALEAAKVALAEAKEACAEIKTVEVGALNAASSDLLAEGNVPEELMEALSVAFSNTKAEAAKAAEAVKKAVAEARVGSADAELVTMVINNAASAVGVLSAAMSEDDVSKKMFSELSETLLTLADLLAAEVKNSIPEKNSEAVDEK